MKLQDQICTLEQAKKLRELGVDFYGLFVHYTNKVLTEDRGVILKEKTASWAAIGEIKNGGVINYYPAFTSSELGIMLPETNGVMAFSTHYNDHFGQWECELRDLVKWEGGESMPPLAHEEEADTEAEARAAMLIHVLENKLATVEEINNRLND